MEKWSLLWWGELGSTMSSAFCADPPTGLFFSMTIANHMLSIYGSILRKPFSIPAPTYVPTLTTPLSISLDNARRVHFQEGHQARTFDQNMEEEEGDSDDDELPSVNDIMRPEVVKEDSKKKKRSKVGPRREGEASGSESEGESKREKKKRKKE
jgi:hypothetical protein